MNWPGNVRSNNIEIRSFTFFQILKLICFTFFVSMLIAGAYGANKNVPPIDEKQVVFRRLPPEVRLTQSQVTAIAQDGAGFIWFGTPSGLNRFDGYKVRKYLKGDAAESIPHDFVRSLLVDSSGVLWVGTGGGLSVYDPGTQSFRYIELLQGSELNVYVIYEAQSGEVLVGTSLGVFSVKTGADKRVRYLDSLREPVRAIAQDTEGQLWVGTERNGLFRQEGNRFVAADGMDKKYGVGPDGYICELLFDMEGNLWIATYNDGLSVLSKTGVFQSFTESGDLEDKRVRALLEDNLGNIWVGSDKGLHKWDRDKQKLHSYSYDPGKAEGLIGNLVYDLFQDVGGVIWVSTFKGVSSFNTQTTQFPIYGLEGLDVDDSISSLAVDSLGKVAVGTHSGVVIWDPLAGTMQDFRDSAGELFSDHVMNILFDSFDQLWIGTYSNGVYLYSKHTLVAHFVHEDDRAASLSSNAITDLYLSSTGDVWVSTFGGGVNRFVSMEEGFERYPELSNLSGQFPDLRCYEIDENALGTLWIGTAEGVFGLDPVTGDTARLGSDETELVDSSDIISVLATQNGIWFGGLEGGLFYFNFSSNELERKFGLNLTEGAAVYGLLSAADESVWIASAGSILRLDGTDKVLKFDHTHGVQVGELNFNADLNLTPEILLFGGNEGVNVIRTEQVRRNDYVPPVRVTQLLLNNKKAELSSVEMLQLEYGVNGLSVEVAALDYTYPQKNRYQYKLQGYDARWIDNGTNRNITYTNLDPGSYLLRVQGSNSDGVWNEDGLSIPITINPPLWATWWAYCAYVALALFSLYQLMIFSSKRINQQAEGRFNRRLRGYVESLDDTAECVLNANQQGNVMFSNNAVAGVLGKRPSEVGGYPLFEMLFQQEAQRHEAKEYVDSGNNFREEVPYLMSDGAEKILEISVSPALETPEDGVAYVSIVRDVTERSREQAALRVSHDQLREELSNLHSQLESTLLKNAAQKTDFSAVLAEKDVLLREIHDRVYDNLGTLTSLLSIQSDKYSDPVILNILGENERRISSIALVHERLYQSREVRRVAMGEYVDVLLSTLYRKLVSEGLEINLVKELGEFDLEIDLAVPCGLIINELFSNALIHGFEGGHHGSGTVEVKLYLLAKECVIFVSDSGRGLPIEVNKEAGSMGFEIVSILVEQLEGSFRLIGGQGTTFEVRFPVIRDGIVG